MDNNNTSEAKLKELIKSRYNSIREFAIQIDMPYSTMDSIFKRGVANSSLTNILKICGALSISADALYMGEIVEINKTALPPLPEKELDARIIKLFATLDKAELEKVIAFAEGLKAARKE